MWSWESVVGAIVAVIVAGMPALLFLLTITYTLKYQQQYV
jgi:hypothetical protein